MSHDQSRDTRATATKLEHAVGRRRIPTARTRPAQWYLCCDSGHLCGEGAPPAAQSPSTCQPARHRSTERRQRSAACCSTSRAQQAACRLTATWLARAARPGHIASTGWVAPSLGPSQAEQPSAAAACHGTSRPLQTGHDTAGAHPASLYIGAAQRARPRHTATRSLQQQTIAFAHIKNSYAHTQTTENELPSPVEGREGLVAPPPDSFLAIAPEPFTIKS